MLHLLIVDLIEPIIILNDDFIYPNLIEIDNKLEEDKIKLYIENTNNLMNKINLSINEIDNEYNKINLNILKLIDSQNNIIEQVLNIDTLIQIKLDIIHVISLQFITIIQTVYCDIYIFINTLNVLKNDLINIELNDIKITLTDIINTMSSIYIKTFTDIYSYNFYTLLTKCILIDSNLDIQILNLYNLNNKLNKLFVLISILKTIYTNHIILLESNLINY